MKTRKFTVLALAFAMVLTMSASVFAQGTRNDLPSTEGVANSGATVVLTKEFNVPLGTAVPQDKFTFTATAVTSSNGEEVVASGHPAISFGEIGFSDSSRASDSDTKLVGTASVDLSALEYPSAGLYEWTVTENQGSNGDISYATNSYVLRVYVKNGANGTEVDMVTVEPGDGGEKVDASKTDDDENTDADNDGNKTNDGNAFRFVNNYKTDEVTTNPDSSDNAGAFKLTKAVTGDYGDKTRKFEFVVTVTLPETLPAGKTAADYASGVQTLGDKEGVVKLADSEKFTIDKLPEGTTITVAEAGTTHYVPSYSGKHTGTNGAAAALSGSANEDKSLETTTIVVGATGAYVDFTNDFNDSNITLTGIVINNLPYVLLIAIALGGIVLFARKRRYE